MYTGNKLAQIDNDNHDMDVPCVSQWELLGTPRQTTDRDLRRRHPNEPTSHRASASAKSTSRVVMSLGDVQPAPQKLPIDITAAARRREMFRVQNGRKIAVHFSVDEMSCHGQHTESFATIQTSNHCVHIDLLTKARPWLTGPQSNHNSRLSGIYFPSHQEEKKKQHYAVEKKTMAHKSSSWSKSGKESASWKPGALDETTSGDSQSSQEQ